MSLPPHTLPIAHPKATKENRRHVITGTDAKRIVEGDWASLFDEKTGAAEAVDLTFAWKPRLGLETEKLHAWWHGHVTGDSFLVCPDQPCYFAHVDVPAHYAATFDFWIPADDCPLELKHTNERNSLYAAAVYYQPQLQWQLLVSAKDRLRFSIIRGNNEPEWGWISRDQDYIDRLIPQVEAFRQVVVSGIRPEPLEPNAPLIAAAAAVVINDLKTYDMKTDNAWIVKEAEYVRLKDPADKFKTTNEELRALIPKDAREVTGKLTSFKRDARGAYRCTILEAEGELC